jgi:hypothetical protein
VGEYPTPDEATVRKIKSDQIVRRANRDNVGGGRWALDADDPPQVGTIGSTIAAGLHMTINCSVRECHHSQIVDLDALQRELGAD